MAYPVPQKDMSRDTVLCPQHNTALEQLLKDLDRLLQQPAAGSA